MRDRIPILKSLATWKIGYFQVQPDTVEDIEHQDEDSHVHSINATNDEIHDDATHHINLEDDHQDEQPQQKSPSQPVTTNNFFDPQ